MSQSPTLDAQAQMNPAFEIAISFIYHGHAAAQQVMLVEHKAGDKPLKIRSDDSLSEGHAKGVAKGCQSIDCCPVFNSPHGRQV